MKHDVEERTVAEILVRELDRRVRVDRGGRARKLSVRRLILEALMKLAHDGDPAAIKRIMKFHQRPRKAKWVHPNEGIDVFAIAQEKLERERREDELWALEQEKGEGGENDS